MQYIHMCKFLDIYFSFRGTIYHVLFTCAFGPDNLIAFCMYQSGCTRPFVSEIHADKLVFTLLGFWCACIIG